MTNMKPWEHSTCRRNLLQVKNFSNSFPQRTKLSSFPWKAYWARWTIKEERCKYPISKMTYIGSCLLSWVSQAFLLYQFLKWRPPISDIAYGLLLNQKYHPFLFSHSLITGVKPTKMTNSPLSPQKFQASHMTSSAGSPYHLHRFLHLGLDSKPTLTPLLPSQRQVYYWYHPLHILFPITA